MFNDGQGDSKNICFLECIGADCWPWHLPRNNNHGHGIHLGGGYARYQIRGPGARGAKTNSHLACGPGIGISSVGAALLVAHQHMLQPTPLFG